MQPTHRQLDEQTCTIPQTFFPCLPFLPYCTRKARLRLPLEHPTKTSRGFGDGVFSRKSNFPHNKKNTQSLFSSCALLHFIILIMIIRKTPSPSSLPKKKSVESWKQSNIYIFWFFFFFFFFGFSYFSLLYESSYLPPQKKKKKWKSEKKIFWLETTTIKKNKKLKDVRVVSSSWEWVSEWVGSIVHCSFFLPLSDWFDFWFFGGFVKS